MDAHFTKRRCFYQMIVCRRKQQLRTQSPLRPEFENGGEREDHRCYTVRRMYSNTLMICVLLRLLDLVASFYYKFLIRFPMKHKKEGQSVHNTRDRCERVCVFVTDALITWHVCCVFDCDKWSFKWMESLLTWRVVNMSFDSRVNALQLCSCRLDVYSNQFVLRGFRSTSAVLGHYLPL